MVDFGSKFVFNSLGSVQSLIKVVYVDESKKPTVGNKFSTMYNSRGDFPVGVDTSHQQPDEETPRQDLEPLADSVPLKMVR